MITLQQMGALPGFALGDMDAGSNALRLRTANHGFRRGSPVIVEVGGEEGAGLRATVGVGGTWPAVSYPDADAIIASGVPAATADGSAPAGYAQDTGDVWYYSTQWFATGPTRYAFQKFMPLALRAKVLEVSGATLYLDRTAVVATSGARVWYDARDLLWQACTSPGFELLIPSGAFAIGSGISYTPRVDGVTIAGRGRDVSRLFSPRGCASLQIATPGGGADDWTIEDLELVGNYSDQGCLVGKQGYQNVGRGPILGTNMDRARITRVRVINGFAVSVSCSGDNSVWRDIEVVEEYPRSHYQGGWALQIHQAVNTHAYDCSFVGRYFTGGFELFSTVDCGFHGIRSVNGAVNTNGSIRPMFEDLDVRHGENSSIPLSVDPFSSSTAAVEWNRNNATGGTAQGGILQRARIELLGPIGQGLNYNALLLSNELPAELPGAKWRQIEIITHGLCKAVNTQVINPPAQVIQIDALHSDGDLWIDSAQITNSTAPLLRYCGNNTEVGEGCSFGVLQDRCA